MHLTNLVLRLIVEVYGGVREVLVGGALFFRTSHLLRLVRLAHDPLGIIRITMMVPSIDHILPVLVAYVVRRLPPIVLITFHAHPAIS